MRIQINLLPGTKKKKTGRAGFEMPDFSELMGSVKDPLLVGALATWAVAIAFMGWVYMDISGRVTELNEEATAIRDEAERHNDMLEQQRLALDLRDSLVAELRAIREIDGDRYNWSHIMEEVSRSLPDYTWLVALENVAVPAVIGDTGAPTMIRFRVDGRTSEIAAYTRFLRQLANSPWISLVEDGPARRELVDGRNMTAFEITVTFQQADSAFILTVPVTESVR